MVSYSLPIPELLPISELRQRQNEILANLRHGPVVLTQHGKAAGILVGTERWNTLIAELDDLRDALDAEEGREELAGVPSSARPLEEIEAELISEGLLDG